MTVPSAEAASSTAHLRKGVHALLRVGGRKYRVTVRDVAEDTIWVSFPGAGYPPEDAGVDLEIHDSGGYFIYHTRVAITPLEENAGVVLRRSESVDYIHHRRSWRVMADLAARIEDDTDRSPFAGRVVDLSSKGALIECDERVETGQRVQLAIAMGDEEVCEVGGSVVRVEDGGRCAVVFEDVAPAAHGLLIPFVWDALKRQQPEQIAALYPRRTARKRAK